MSEQELLESMPRGEELEKVLAQAYRVYQYNIRQADPFVYELTKGAKAGVPEKELLDIALQALDRCRYSLEEDGGA